MKMPTNSTAELLSIDFRANFLHVKTVLWKYHKLGAIQVKKSISLLVFSWRSNDVHILALI